MGWVTDETNEHGAMALLDAKETGPRACLDARIFTHFLMEGMVTLLSVFF
jgi:hypothetical protein